MCACMRPAVCVCIVSVSVCVWFLVLLQYLPCQLCVVVKVGFSSLGGGF